MECKIQKKSSSFWDKSVWTYCKKFCVLRQEYLSSAVNVLGNSLKNYHQSKAVFFQLNLPEIHGVEG